MNDPISYLAELGPRLLSSGEVAAILGVHQETIYKWTKARTLSYVRVGRNKKFNPVVVLEYLQSRSV